ncbi:hypothetical protein WISP_112232 [Willisornis vidua]|uniref:Uncharacterized protein n=1 Tax=Willisornis vidua TaxID=1566151 RepID=A0ABQ9D161_9PASS|nr:hypothetical protein WISP_112232 [Willisornis vidua]
MPECHLVGIGSYLRKCLNGIDDIDEGNECTLTKFASDGTNLSGAVDLSEGQHAIQRDLDMPEKWAHGNFMWFNKTRCKVLHLGCSSPQYQYRLGDEQIESSPAKKDLGVVVGERLDMTWQCALTAQTANHVLSCMKSSVASRIGFYKKEEEYYKSAESTRLQFGAKPQNELALNYSHDIDVVLSLDTEIIRLRFGLSLIFPVIWIPTLASYLLQAGQGQLMKFNKAKCWILHWGLNYPSKVNGFSVNEQKLKKGQRTEALNFPVVQYKQNNLEGVLLA